MSQRPSANPRRLRRLRTACERCQRRKIRCDAAAPSCAACAKVGEDCIYEDAPHVRRRRNLSHALSSVQDDSDTAERIRWLESIVRQEAPHVDLAPDGVAQHAQQTSHDEIDTTGQGSNDPESPPVAMASPTASVPRRPIQVPAISQPTPDETATNTSTGSLSHEIGLVSLSAGVDPRYVGPSSGYFFTRLLGAASRSRRVRTSDETDSAVHAARIQRDRDLSMRVFSDAQYSLPATKELAKELSDVFFTTVHLQYPFLHQPTHRRLIDQVYDSVADPTGGMAYFQVAMVLSISALVMSRRSRVELPANGWCAAALARFNSAQVENSLKGLQSLLLLLIYAMHSPSSKFNAWFLNYQCIAMVLDLGLQRDPGSAASLSPYQREMRTRIFWVVYSLDRKLSTMMGRPIGLRDEACDLRLPADLDDFALETCDQQHSRVGRPSHMSYAIHFFRLSRINSEIKYVSHSVQRNTPAYAYPAIRDIIQWQDDVSRQLDEWSVDIPANPGRDLEYAQTLCQIQYHTTKMLLLLPSPGIPCPRPECQRGCYKSSVSALRLFNTLYTQDMLIYNWNTCHSVILHTFCLIYCIVALPSLADETSLEDLMFDLRSALNILSATGEHWAGAKRSRDLLEDIAGRALQIVSDRRMGGQLVTGRPPRGDTLANADIAAATMGDNNRPNLSLGNSGTTGPVEEPLGTTALSQEQLDSFYSTLFDGSSTCVDNLDFVSHDFDISQLFTEVLDFPAANDDLY